MRANSFVTKSVVINVCFHKNMEAEACFKAALEDSSTVKLAGPESEKK